MRVSSLETLSGLAKLRLRIVDLMNENDDAKVSNMVLRKALRKHTKDFNHPAFKRLCKYVLDPESDSESEFTYPAFDKELVETLLAGIIFE